MTTSALVCQYCGCRDSSVPLSIYCARHHAEMLDAVHSSRERPPNPEITRVITDPEFAEAFMVWVGHDARSCPACDDDAINSHYGEARAARLLPLLRLVIDDFYASDAAIRVPGMKAMVSRAKEEFAIRYPSSPPEIVEALAWCYSFDNR